MRSRNGASNRVLRLALLGELPTVCHYKLLSEYSEVLFRMVGRGHKQKSFPLRIADQDRLRARRLAQKMGLSENRLYSDLIQEGLLLREQMTYFEKLRAMRIPAKEGLALLDLAPDVAPDADDTAPRRRRGAPLR